MESWMEHGRGELIRRGALPRNTTCARFHVNKELADVIRATGKECVEIVDCIPGK